ncbi:MAG: UDP-N-acetylmuramoyl-L-alanyl-D-glutamate--2,6-diaminopimelate ligase [Alphaproteobacteria bacterium]|jgi:UDP-N-acetylmuramoyl-L-alanyl-D-glutamate--2,6-diaminopimelate ligase|nr:UDP-N-acetylmuramoyl-L-alanyl-D-glutamate--2,6-diaminopimelate ligase [Alphaproteobacteria bacterium]
MTLTDLEHYLRQGISQQGTLDQNGSLPFLGVSQDTRKVMAGDVFVVIPCDQAETHARAAAKAGAVAIIAEPDFAEAMHGKLDVPILVVPSARRAVSQCSVLLYPAQPDTIVAVTGTNGKSSVVTAVRQIWQNLGFAAASLGTLGVDLSYQVKLLGDLPTTKLTSPDALSFHQILNALEQSHVSHCAFEASSHGLDQFRLHGADLTAAGFTNLSQDHLDYHPTMDDYFEAKSKLFMEVLPADKTAVLNVASAYFPALKAMCSGRGQTVISYGVDQQADLMAENVRLSSDQIRFDLNFKGEKWSNIPLNMVGAFQVENVLCAMGLVHAAGVPVSKIVEALPSLCSAPGRMELVGKTPQGNAIFIDYAHTPDALSRALCALRKHVTGKGRLRVVFGCGGNRDAGKRSQMGEVADTLADDVYITDDNPRDEDPAFIRAQIMVACPKAHEIGDRSQAIRTAIHNLSPNDVLLIAGKGHEHGQIIGDRVVPFDDRTEAQAILKEGVAA